MSTTHDQCAAGDRPEKSSERWCIKLEIAYRFSARGMDWQRSGQARDFARRCVANKTSMVAIDSNQDSNFFCMRLDFMTCSDWEIKPSASTRRNPSYPQFRSSVPSCNMSPHMVETDHDNGSDGDLTLHSTSTNLFDFVSNFLNVLPILDTDVGLTEAEDK